MARVGGNEFAVLTVFARNEEAAALAAKLEASMARQESPITFGWAAYPADGENALSSTAQQTSGSPRGSSCGANARRAACTWSTPEPRLVLAAAD